MGSTVVVFNKQKAARLFAIVLVVASTLVAAFLVAPISSPGIPMNGDVPLHYGVSVCYDKGYSWSWPSAWCSYSQAGLAPSQGYAILHQHVISWFNAFLPLELAFKLGMVVVYMSEAVCAALLLLALGEPIAAAVAYALILLSNGNTILGGFSKVFLHGAFAYSFGVAGFFLALAGVIWFFRRPSRISSVGAGLALSLGFLAHASIYVAVVASLPVVVWLYRDSVIVVWKRFLGIALASFLMVQYWLLPFWSKQGSFSTYSGGGLFETNYFLGDAAPLLLVAVVGIPLLWRDAKLERRLVARIAVALIAFAILEYLFPWFIVFKFIHPNRVLTLLVSLAFVVAAVLAGYLVERLPAWSHFWKPFVAILAVSVFINLLVVGASLSQESSQRIRTSSMEPFATALRSFSLFENATGRITLQDTRAVLSSDLGASHIWAVAPEFSDKEFLGLDDFWYQHPDFSHVIEGWIFNESLDKMPPGHIEGVFDELDIEYIGGMEEDQNFMFTLRGADTRFRAFQTNITPSKFKFAQGNLSDIKYDGVSASARVDSEKGGTVLFKVRSFPNWAVTLDDQSVIPRRSRFSMMEVDVPAGRHFLRFEYRLLSPVDIIGYVLSAIGLVLLVVVSFAPISWFAISPQASSDERQT